MHYLMRKIIFSAIFVALVVIMFVINVPLSAPEIAEEIKSVAVIGNTQSLAELIKEMTDTMNDKVFARTEMVESFSACQAMLGKRENTEFRYVKDEAGYLHEAEFFKADDPNSESYALRVRSLQDSLAAKGTKMLFVIPPSKYRRETASTDLALPVANPERDVSKLAFYLNQYGVNVINFDQILPSDDLPYEECFFKTEHYWTIPAAYEAATQILKWMNSAGRRDLDPDGRWLSPEAFDRQVYPNTMLGSIGRKCGEAYAGREDFVALWPKETRNYKLVRYYSKDREVLYGTTYDVLVDKNIITQESGLPGRSCYSSYLGTENTHDVISNLEIPDGVKVLAIRDSYFSPVLTFLAPVCGEIESVWSSNEETYYSLSGVLDGNKYDYVIIEIDPYRINNDAFDFFVGEAWERMEKREIQEAGA